MYYRKTVEINLGTVLPLNGYFAQEYLGSSDLN